MIAKIWNQLRCPSVDERMKKMGHIDLMDYHSAIEEVKSCHLTATWIELEFMM